MDASSSQFKGLILSQLQSDAPQSPLVGHLRSRLSSSDDDDGAATSPYASNSSGSGSGSSFTNAATSSDPQVNNADGWTPPTPQIESHTSANSQAGAATDGNSQAGAATDGTRVKTHSHRPISADFLNSSSSAAMQSRDPAGNGNGHPGAETKRENNNNNHSNSSGTSSSSSRPESYVLVHNVAKRHNLGTIARSATAFGVSELILVGRKDFNAFGSHGASLHMQFRHFHTLPEAALYLKAKDVDICGVEIVEGATAVHKHPFTRSTAFVLGNEGTGLSKKEMDICNFFVYIPQCGSGTASLNVTVAASIVLHHFSVWAGFAERERQGQKFVVAERPVRRTPRNVVDDPDAVKERRRQKADNGIDDWLLCDREDANESDEATEGREAHTIEFPGSKKTGLLSNLNSLYC